MRNLKRALSLVMAMALIVGMMVVSASAAGKDFTDSDEIDHKEAVNTMVSLNVIAGKEDGSYYDPNGSLTRAEMAKVVAYIMNGGVEPNIGTKVVPTYSDIDNHWAEAYIEYCTSMGIINGDGQGKFNPQGTLTGEQAAKMFLTAMGYNANVFGFTGADWAINVGRYANEAGLYDELGDITPSATISRDDAAQMAYNAIQATMMERTWSQDMASGEIRETYQPWIEGSGNNAVSVNLLGNKFNAAVYTGVVADVTYTSSNKEYTYASFPGNTADDNFVNNANKGNHVQNFATTDDYTAFEGEEVSVIVRNERNGDQTVLGIYPTGKSTVETANVSTLEADGAKLKVNGTSYELENGLTTGLVDETSHDTIKLVDSDDNGKLDIAIVTTVTPGKVTYVSDEEIIAGGTTYKFADDEIPSGLARNDYVSVVTKLNEVNVVTKLDAIEGTVTGEKVSDDLIEVNGTWYNRNGETMALGSSYKFYAVNGVVVDGSVEAISGASISNLVMVLDRDSTADVLDAKALVMDATGKKSLVTIDKSGVSPNKGSLYFYEETSAGYKFKTPTNTADGNYTWVAGVANDITLSSASNTMGTGTVYTIADDAVVFVWTPDDGNGAIITGKQLKSLTVGTGVGKLDANSKGFFYSEVKGLERVSYAGVALDDGDIDDLGVTGGNTAYGYIVSNGYQVRLNNDTYTTYDLWNGDDTVTVYEKGTVSARAKGTVVKYDSIGTDNIITGVSDYDLSAGEGFVAAIRGMEGDYVYLNGTAAANAYELTSDTKYLYIDSNASAEDIGKAGGEVVLADEYGTGIYMDNVIAVTNAADEVVLLVVDVKNNMTTSINATLTATKPTVTKATTDLSKDEDIKAGDAIEVTVTATDDFSSTVTLTLTHAQAADGTSTVTIPKLADGQTYKVTVFADGNGNVSFS